MLRLVVSFGIGVIAGVVDVVPMMIQKLDRHATAFAFVQWVVLGFLISYVQLPIAPWLKGVVVAELVALPTTTLMVKSDPKSVMIIVAMSALLGAAVGVATAAFAA